ncbi:MAG: DUF2500 domain-containing protein [Erysipelotrichaceae bacterium]|jgi:hypothetical protein
MFEFVFMIVPVFVLGVFIFIAYNLISQKIKNDKSPILRVEATVIAKRINVSTGSHHHRHVAGSAPHYHSSTSTSHYVTFELADGERKEFLVYGKEYGLLIEKDRGYLTYQGTRFKGFEIIS